MCGEREKGGGRGKRGVRGKEGERENGSEGESEEHFQAGPRVPSHTHGAGDNVAREEEVEERWVGAA